MKLSRARIAFCLAIAWLAPALSQAEEGGDEAPGTRELIGNFFTTLWAIGAFLVVLYILWKKLLPPIVEGLDRRAQAIREGLEAAEKAKEEALEIMARHRDELEKARQEARQVIEQGKAEAEKVKDRIVGEARAEAENVATRARREIESAKQSAVAELQQQSIALSIDLASRLVGKTLQAADHERIIQESVESFRAPD